MKKHIIFDFDDTISSSYELNQQLFIDTFEKFKDKVDEDYLRKLHFESKGTTMLAQFSEAVEKFDLKIDPQQLVTKNEQIHLKSSSHMSLFEGIELTLKHFKSHKKIISICSNRDVMSLNKILKIYRLEKYFDNIISCREAGHEKPDPYCLKLLMGKYPNITPGQTIYFGDSATDAKFAENARIDFVIIDHYLNKKLFYQLILESFADSEDTSVLPR